MVKISENMQVKVDNNGGSKMGASKWEQAMMGKSK